MAALPEIKSLTSCQPGQGQNQSHKMLHVVEGWLRAERDARRVKEEKEAAAKGTGASGGTQADAPVQPTRTPLMPSKHLAFFR